MKRPSFKGEQRFLPVLAASGSAVGLSIAAYYAGQALAYVSLVFGVLFFAFAARYYVATVSVLLAPSVKSNGNKNGTNGNGVGKPPMVSIHVALYNEERVVDRLLTACSAIDYPNYEVVVVDDSNDGTVQKLKEWIRAGMKSGNDKLKIIHRDNRSGFKGGALNEAIRQMSPRAEYVLIFDADFVPEPDIVKKFLAYFNIHGDANGPKTKYNGKLAAVQGYQWHTLNRTENWLTRGVSCEFSGNYMVDRTFQEVTGTMKMVAGSVYMIRGDLLRELGWSGSITEDWEMTLRLYERGYKVLYTPLVQAPAECPSTLGKLIRQRMRWAEGHTYNVKKHFIPILTSHKVGLREKLEFLYFAPYYLQSLFLIAGTFSWFTSDFLLGAKLPFLIDQVGWGLVITNLLALPIMSLTGLFLEKRARRDFGGVASQLVLIYALSPYQAYAALKGLIEPVEGSWVRTFKSGKLSGFPGKLEPRKVIKEVLPPRKRASVATTKAATAMAIGVGLLFTTAMIQGQLVASTSSNPSYYFYNQSAPPSYAPFSSTPSGSSLMMHVPLPRGPDATRPIGSLQSSGLVFFSDTAPSSVNLPFGTSVSMHLWINDHQPSGVNNQGNLKFRIDVYDPANNTIIQIPGVGETEVFHLQQGLHLYETSWGHIAQGKSIPKGDTLVATIWCPDCQNPPTLVFNSPAHPSSIDFPIEVPEDYLPLVTTALLVPGIAGIVVTRRLTKSVSGPPEGGLRSVQTSLIVAAAVIFLTLPIVLTLGDLLASAATATGFDNVVSTLAPSEASLVADLLRGFGFPAGSAANAVWLGSGFIPVTALIDWNCVGWQGFVLFGLTSAFGLGGVKSARGKVTVILIGLGGVFAINVLRITGVVLLDYYVNYSAAMIFHDYGGAILTLAWLFGFWTLVLKREKSG